MRNRWLFPALLLVGFFSVSSCSTLGYYSQAVGGHLDIMIRSRPMARVMADRSQPVEVKDKLRLISDARRFATDELKLPSNRSYVHYADIGRKFVVWNVTATPALSVDPVEWCYPVAGCFRYKGFFSRSDAKAFAASLEARGFDVSVSGASAYSTLGWFDDPVLSTMLRHPEPDLLATLFHELAHQKLFINGDSAFNEAFAVVVAEEGVRRWYAGGPGYDEFVRNQERLRAVTDLFLKTRRRLASVYASSVSDAEKLAEKRAILDEMRASYETLRETGGDGESERRLPAKLNNAHLALTATYHELVPGLKALLAMENGDLDGFYAAAATLSALRLHERRDRLHAVLLHVQGGQQSIKHALTAPDGSGWQQ